MTGAAEAVARTAPVVAGPGRCWEVVARSGAARHRRCRPHAPCRSRWIDEWHPEDGAFWAGTGARVARRNLACSVLTEHVGFAVWAMWSALLLFLGPEYGLTPAQRFTLTSVPVAVGALLRPPKRTTAGRASRPPP